MMPGRLVSPATARVLRPPAQEAAPSSSKRILGCRVGPQPPTSAGEASRESAPDRTSLLLAVVDPRQFSTTGRGLICLRSRTRQQGQDICIKPGRKEFTMCSSSRLERTTTANIGKMMGRLGIDMAYAALPRYGLAFSSALRACNSCTARAQCAQWMAKTRHTAFGPPKFCASADLLWELLCDPAIGHRPQSVQLRAGETCGGSCRDIPPWTKQPVSTNPSV